MKSLGFNVAFVVFLLYLAKIDADDEILDKLESMSSRIGNIEETLGSLVVAVSKLENVYECGWPNLVHGHYEGNSSYYRGVLRAFCDEGYTLKGDPVIRCQPDGIWTEQPKCFGPCYPPNIPTIVELDKTQYIIDSQITAQCKPGYKRLGSGTMTCLGDNKWSDAVTCDPVDCGKPYKDRHGTFGDTYSTTFNSTVSLECEEGYKKAGPEVIRCHDDGSWDGDQRCLERMCVDLIVQRTPKTECLLKQVETSVLGADIIGTLSTYDIYECFVFCFERHPSFSFITVNDYRGRCFCERHSGNNVQIQYSHYFTYFREDFISAFAP